MSHHHHGHRRSSSVSSPSSSLDNNYYSGHVQQQQQQQQHQQQVAPQIYNTYNSLDFNFDTIKNEHNNLSELVFNIYNSLNSYCNSIKDIYLNSNSFMNNVTKLFGNEHPLSKYGNGVLMMADESFKDWMNNQEPNFTQLGDYVNELNDVKLKIDRIDQLSTTLTDNNINEYIELKEQVFKEVSEQFENRVNKFDIPLINTQFSFPSLYSCLNSIHETNSNEQLQQPIEVDNPVVSLIPDNTLAYNVIQAQQVGSYQPQQVPPKEPAVNTRVNTAPSNYVSPTMILSRPIKTEVTYAAPPKTLQKLGAREYTRNAPSPQQPTPLKPLARPPSSPLSLSSNSSPPTRTLPNPVEYQPQPTAPPPQQPIVAPTPIGGRQVLPHNPNSNNNNSSMDTGSGVVSQPLRPVPHKSVQVRPSFPINNGAANNKPPLSPSTPTPNLYPQPYSPQQPIQQPVQQQQQSPFPPKPRPVSGAYSLQASNSQPNLYPQPQSPSPPVQQPNRPQPITSSQSISQTNLYPNLQQQQPPQPLSRPRSSSLSGSQSSTPSFSRPLPSVLNSSSNNTQQQQ